MQQLKTPENAIGGDFTREEIEKALKQSDNSSAAGLDGFMFEFWKGINAKYVKDSKNSEEHAFDVVELFQLLFNDIKEHTVKRISTEVQYVCIGNQYTCTEHQHMYTEHQRIKQKCTDESGEAISLTN